jgi:hypothetical protein
MLFYFSCESIYNYVDREPHYMNHIYCTQDEGIKQQFSKNLQLVLQFHLVQPV